MIEKEGGKMWERGSQKGSQQEKGICRRAKWQSDVFFVLMMCKGETLHVTATLPLS